MVGQLIQVGHYSATLTADLRALLTDDGFGSVLLLGNALGSQPAISRFTQALAGLDAPVPVVVAVDQEGGQVQRLKGAGFSTIPSAVRQSRRTPTQTAKDWQGWAGELADAGVAWNHAPVADAVPVTVGPNNAPIGALARNYGTTPAEVAAFVPGIVRAQRASGVATTLKHFPGLGAVRDNTDFRAAVDSVTRRSAATVAAFSAGIQAGTDAVMMSSARYQHLGDEMACFSPDVVTGWLRTELGFDRVVISDDLAAPGVGAVPVAERGVRFVNAGGDVIISTEAALAQTMAKGILARATKDATFADRVEAACARVLALKRTVIAAD